MKTPHVWAKLSTPASAVLFYGLSPEHSQAEARAGGHPLLGSEAQTRASECLFGWAAISPLSAVLPVMTCASAALTSSFHWHFLKQHSPQSSLDVPFSLPVTFHLKGDVISLQVLLYSFSRTRIFKHSPGRNSFKEERKKRNWTSVLKYLLGTVFLGLWHPLKGDKRSRKNYWSILANRDTQPMREILRMDVVSLALYSYLLQGLAQGKPWINICWMNECT